MFFCRAVSFALSTVCFFFRRLVRSLCRFFSFSSSSDAISRGLTLPPPRATRYSSILPVSIFGILVKINSAVVKEFLISSFSNSCTSKTGSPSCPVTLAAGAVVGIILVGLATGFSTFDAGSITGVITVSFASSMRPSSHMGSPAKA